MLSQAALGPTSRAAGFSGQASGPEEHPVAGQAGELHAHQDHLVAAAHVDDGVGADLAHREGGAGIQLDLVALGQAEVDHTVEAGVLAADDLGAGPATFRNDNRKEFTGLAFHPSGRYLAATSNDATVKLYDTTTWALAQAFNWDIGRLRSVSFSPNGMLAAAGGDKGKIVIWDVDF